MAANDPQSRYIGAARQHGEGTLAGDHAATNKAHAILMDALTELRKMPDSGVAFLSGLLSDHNLSVVTWAAVHLLPFRESAATFALQRVAKSGMRLMAFDAEMVLKEWAAGRLKVD